MTAEQAAEIRDKDKVIREKDAALQRLEAIIRGHERKAGSDAGVIASQSRTIETYKETVEILRRSRDSWRTLYETCAEQRRELGERLGVALNRVGDLETVATKLSHRLGRARDVRDLALNQRDAWRSLAQQARALLERITKGEEGAA